MPLLYYNIIRCLAVNQVNKNSDSLICNTIVLSNYLNKNINVQIISCIANLCSSYIFIKPNKKSITKSIRKPQLLDHMMPKNKKAVKFIRHTSLLCTFVFIQSIHVVKSS